MDEKPRKPPVWLLVALGCVVLVGALFMSVQTSTASVKTPEAPQPQPVDFYHRIHVQERKIDCLYCHRTATKADFAGMPSTELCMSCHRSVIPEYPEIWKLRSYWELGEGIPWKRVNQLPGHVYFSHQAHTAVAKLGCDTCHGDVASMGFAEKAAPLTMGWCLECHRKQNASTECSACHR